MWGNSGEPVFDASSGTLEGINIASGADSSIYSAEGCKSWNKIDSSSVNFAGEALTADGLASRGLIVMLKNV